MFTNSQIDIALNVIETNVLMRCDVDDLELIRFTLRDENESKINHDALYNVIDNAMMLYDAIESREYTQREFINAFRDFIRAIRDANV
jgi:hypothetical protein